MVDVDKYSKASLGYKRNDEYCGKVADKMEYTERYELFLKIGGRSTREYVMFISRVKKLYLENRQPFSTTDTIIDHDAFTVYIKDFVAGFIIANDRLDDFLK